MEQQIREQLAKAKRGGYRLGAKADEYLEWCLTQITEQRKALEQALRQWESYANEQRGPGNELDYLEDSNDPEDLEAQEYKRIRSLLERSHNP